MDPKLCDLEVQWDTIDFVFFICGLCRLDVILD